MTFTSEPSTKQQRRLSLTRIFNKKSSDSTSTPLSPIMQKSQDVIPPVPQVPLHYRHSMMPSMENIQHEMLRERRKSIVALADNSGRSVSLDICSTNSTQGEKMRKFDELLQQRRGSTIRMTLTPSLLSDSDQE